MLHIPIIFDIAGEVNQAKSPTSASCRKFAMSNDVSDRTQSSSVKPSSTRTSLSRPQQDSRYKQQYPQLPGLKAAFSDYNTRNRYVLKYVFRDVTF